MFSGLNYRSFAFMLVFCVAFALVYTAGFSRFLDEFPESYTWSDLMIAYQGGYVRRGLLGEIAFLLDGPLGARSVLATIIAVAYAVVTVFFVRRAWRIGPWIGTLFLLSPATPLFPLLDPDAFGRKDALILLAFVSSVVLTRSCGTRVALLIVVMTYAVANFIVDSAIFYAPMAMFAVSSGARDIRRRAVAVEAAVLSGLFVVVFSLTNLALNAKFNNDNMVRYQQKIVVAWRARYPTSFQVNSAVEYIGLSARDGIELVLQNLSEPPTFAVYLVALPLALVPTLLLLTRIDRGRATGWETAGCALAIAWGFVPFVFAADWGRYIHLMAMQTFLVVGCLPLRREAAPERWGTRAVAVLAIVTYATSWRMLHFIDGGSSAIRPGIAFEGP